MRRLLAFGIDWVVILLWAALLFAVVMIGSYHLAQNPGGPWRTQAIGFFSMTLPVILYFSLCEASAWRASIGKRLLSLQLSGKHAERAPFSRILLRNVVKFAPWELGHLVANQAIFSASEVPGWVYVPMLLSLALPLWWLISIFLQGASPYDQLSGTKVTFIR